MNCEFIRVKKLGQVESVATALAAGDAQSLPVALDLAAQLRAAAGLLRAHFQQALQVRGRNALADSKAVYYVHL